MIHLKEKITPEILHKLCGKFGYWFPTDNKPYNCFVFGIRNSNSDQSKDSFNDLIGVYYKNELEENRIELFKATTDPGRLELLDPSFEAAQIGGTAIIAEGQYRTAYKLGQHGYGNLKHEALIQVKPISIYRDKNKDEILDFHPSTTEEGYFGINIHASSLWRELDKIGRNSAGCQVFSSDASYFRFMFIINKQVEFGLGDYFSYTLFKESDILPYISSNI